MTLVQAAATRATYLRAGDNRPFHIHSKVRSLVRLLLKKFRRMCPLLTFWGHCLVIKMARATKEPVGVSRRHLHRQGGNKHVLPHSIPQQGTAHVGLADRIYSSHEAGTGLGSSREVLRFDRRAGDERSTGMRMVLGSKET